MSRQDHESGAQHTPGPFVVASRADLELPGHLIQTAPDELPVAIIPKNRRPDDEVRANADLFAAAPDMLAALKLAVAGDLVCTNPHDEHDCSLDVMSAAIAKAEGRS